MNYYKLDKIDNSSTNINPIFDKVYEKYNSCKTNTKYCNDWDANNVVNMFLPEEYEVPSYSSSL